MAVPVEPGENGGGGGGSEPPGGGAPPPTDPSTKLAFQVTSTNIVITSDQIAAAGGPWPAFKVKVTPVNANGNGTPETVSVTVGS